ncbi:g9807 [Coccomyxa viridis]|uniref:G9807 protein n=1 Tax=Coccomyxa viridis TaxID=1274662 RepID=A0ABP1G8R2_9CHLO
MRCRQLDCVWRTEFMYLYEDDRSADPFDSIKVDWRGRFRINLDRQAHPGSPTKPLILGPSEHFRAWTFFEWDAVPPPLQWASMILAVGLASVAVLAAACAVANKWPGSRIQEYQEAIISGMHKKFGKQDLKDLEDEAEGKTGNSGAKEKLSTGKTKDEAGAKEELSTGAGTKTKDEAGAKEELSTGAGTKDKGEGDKHKDTHGGGGSKSSAGG